MIITEPRKRWWPITSQSSGPGLALQGGTFFLDSSSAWCIGCAGTRSKSSPSLTVGVGRATGGRDFDRISGGAERRPLHSLLNVGSDWYGAAERRAALGPRQVWSPDPVARGQAQ